MKNCITKLVACATSVALVATLSFGLAGCSTVKTAASKLNDRLDSLSSAAAALSEDSVRTPQAEVSATGDNTVTVLVYMNGSNLESEGGEATIDLGEMVSAGTSDKVNVVVQTMGTKQWQNYGISSRHTQRYKVDGSGLTLVDDSLGQLSCTDPDTLSDFITWGAKNYPADRYELIMWDHGGGPVYGYGYDETTNSDDTMSVDEIQSALKKAGIYFDFIGMDCCLMSSLETCCAFYNYCDYAILSEDFESGLGWSYSNWLSSLMANPTISTSDLGKIIVDDMVKANTKDKDWGGDATLAVIDESMMKVLFTAWTDFAYANESTLLSTNYSTELQRNVGNRDSLVNMKKGLFTDLLVSGMDSLLESNEYGYYDDYSSYASGYSWDDLFSDYGSYSSDTYDMSDYYVTDIMAAAANIDSTESAALKAALSDAIVYYNATDSDSELTGLSVTLPYGDSQFYSEMSTVFKNCGIDSDYITWLGKFVSASGSSNYYDYSSWADQWSGWGDYSQSFDWSGWGNTHDSSTLDNNASGWDQYSYDDAWNSWYLENSGQSSQGYPGGFGR